MPGIWKAAEMRRDTGPLNPYTGYVPNITRWIGGSTETLTLSQARCRNVIYSILDPNPTRRITASQVLKSEWGREIKLCKAGEDDWRTPVAGKTIANGCLRFGAPNTRSIASRSCSSSTSFAAAALRRSCIAKAC